MAQRLADTTKLMTNSKKRMWTNELVLLGAKLPLVIVFKDDVLLGGVGDR